MESRALTLEREIARDFDVNVQVTPATTINGKRFFVIPTTLNTTISALRQKVKQAAGPYATKVPTLSFEGVLLEDDKTIAFYNYSIRSQPIVAHGMCDIILIDTVGVENCVQIPWSVHATTTDVAKAVYKKYKVSLDLLRIVHEGKEVPFRNTYTVRSDALRWEIHLQELGFVERVAVRRSKNGVVEHIFLQMTEVTTVQHLHETVMKNANGEYDDDDEEICPHGAKFLFLYTPRVAGYTQLDLMDGEYYLSYLRPTEYPPTFISIEQDYTIRHLTDLEIYPAACLQIEFYCPWTKQWSGSLQFNTDANELVTVRSRKGFHVRVPTTLDETFEIVKSKLWCMTNDNPMFTTLVTEEGVILHEHLTLRKMGLTSSVTIYAVRTPKAWESPELVKPVVTSSWANLEDKLLVHKMK
eukprot:PhF_6_TR5112/c0_g1_i1/m.7214